MLRYLDEWELQALCDKGLLCICDDNTVNMSGFGGLEVSVLASGTQVRGFKPG